ncbi:UNVERIFIED_CONTAM: hypothetical protein PYX00_010218 [Menopon gallinae]|uniref:Uncharacterized protein n=1 Tax=Menopon gallinae TaxID=328185 RepID=A0AAW2HEG3_9NEOP
MQRSYGVPTIEVHHDTSGYDSTHQQSIVPPPAPVVEHSPDSTIPASYGLPLGNIPTAHGLLPPINQVKINPVGLVPPPPTVLHPVPTDGLLPSIPFPELSPVPVVPLHNSNPFLQVETADLVPPIPPQKSVSNVVFTISENGPNHANTVIDNHIGQSDLHGSDQHTDSSSLINSHLLTHQFQGQYNPYNPSNNQVNLDIVKSVPVAEYTSSIQYPLQVIQSPQYIDITSLPNITNVETPTYEKEPQTGSQKISDILFGLVKDTESKKSFADTNASGNKILQQTKLQTQQTQHINHYLPTNPPPIVNEAPNFVDSGKSFTQQNSVYTQQQNAVWTGGNSPPFANSQPHQPKLESGNDGLFTDPTATSWLIPAQSNLSPQWILPVSNPPSVPYPLLPEEEGIASAVNGELSPTPPPQPMNDSKTKKIQIIIPYTTGDNNKNVDQNFLESEVQKPSIVSAPQPPPPTAAPLSGNNLQGRKTPGQQVATFSVPSNATQNSKFINDVHHILAFNIKELLKDEVEKPKAEQNIRLQKNIDNWTALEYSNHKTVAKKEPLDVISYANAVTSIPGTSINHLLLTSKKIPDKYLTTTPLPLFDEPATTQFAAGSGVSVESKPFTTKTYDTSGLYSTVTRIAPTTTTLKTIIKDVLTESKNHRNGYTEVVKTKANQWGKLNENLVLPEKVSNRSTTATWSDKKSSTQDEKVYVVTPVSVWQTSGSDSSKRTTRQVFMTEKPETETGTISPEATKSYISKLFGNKTERAKISKFNKPKLIQKFFATTKAPPRNITKVQIKDIPLTKVEEINELNVSNDAEIKSINDVFPFRNGGELPVELALANKTDDSLAQGSDVRKAVKQSKINKNTKDFRKVKTQNSTEEVVSTTPTISLSK